MSDRSKNLRDVASDEAKDILVNDFGGARQWKRSKLGYLSGVGAVTDLARGIGRATSGGAERIGSMARAVYSRRQEGIAVDADIIDSAEKFRESARVNGKSDEDLRLIQDNTYRGFYLYALFLAISVAGGIASLRYDLPQISGFPPLDIAFRFFLVPLLLSMTLRWGYVNWIVRRRRLDGVMRYLTSGQWFPAKSDGDNRGGRTGPLTVTIAAVAILGAVSIGSMDAVAQETTQQGIEDVFASPGNDDIFMRMLSYVVPNVGPVPGLEGTDGAQMPGHSALAVGFATFSGVLLLIASSLLSWFVMAGIVASAHEGKVLGQRWHQIWAPMRVTLGIGMLAPVAGGYCAAQILVLHLIVWGGNIANLVWIPYVDALASGGAAGQTVETSEDPAAQAYIYLPNTYMVVREVFARELCFASVETWAERNGEDAIDIQGEYVIEPETEIMYKTWEYGKWCGEVGVEIVAPHLVDEDDASQQASVRFGEAKVAAMSALRTALRGPATVIARTYQPGTETAPPAFDVPGTVDSSFLSNAIRQYNASVVAAAQALHEELNSANGGVSAFAEDAKRTGWASAGTFYLTISRLHGTVFAKAAEGPQFEAIDMNAGWWRGSPARDFVWNDETNTGVLPSFEQWWNANIDSIADSELDPNAALAGRLDPGGSDIAEVLNAVFPFENIFAIWHVDPLTPIDDMISFGQALMTIVLSALLVVAVLTGGIAAGGLAGGVSGLASGGPIGAIFGAAAGAFASGVLGSILGTILPFVWMLLFALFAVGAVHAFVLPMIPWIQVTFFLMGMLILCAEALVGAILWAFFHVRMDGQEFVDSVQRPGYMIAFNLLLRPTMMIFGLIMSFTIFGAMMWFTRETFEIAMNVATEGYIFGPITMIVMLVILTYVHYQIALRSFSLINELPERVSRWFGQGGENLGEGKENEQFVGAVVGHVSRKTEGMSSGAGLSKAVSSGGGGAQGGVSRSTANTGHRGSGSDPGSGSGRGSGDVSGGKGGSPTETNGR